MSKLTAAAATSHTVSVTAMEEASRLGDRTAGLDHLLLALTVNEQIAGQVLRSFGVTLEAARAAVAEQHAEQLASLGIQSTGRPPGRITFHETGTSEWSAGALAVIKRSAEGKKKGDAAAVLRELIAEPSGLIEAILHRVDVTPEALRDRLDEVERYPARSQHTFASTPVSGSSESFVPAEIAQVWDLLADPMRMAEWEPGTASVGSVSPSVDIGSCWEVRALQERPDGKPIRVKPQYRTARVELTGFEEQRRIEWCFTWPDAPKSNARRVAIELEPAAGGTHLLISTAWIRNSDATRTRIPMLRWLMRPVHRFAIWIQIMQISTSISRVFRQGDAETA